MLDLRLRMFARQVLPLAITLVIAGIVLGAVLITRPTSHHEKTTVQATSVRVAAGKTKVLQALGGVARGGTRPVAVTAGDYSTCAIDAHRTVVCWGDNTHGQLGDGGRVAAATPQHVLGLRGVVKVSVGGSRACALLRSGAVECWGSNAHGGLGNGTARDAARPVAVKGLTAATAISAGVGHACAILRNAAVECWGANGEGQLGNGTHTDASAPTLVHLRGNAVAVAAGLAHTCALIAGGSVQCWGANGNGQLGNGTHASSSTPVAVRDLGARAVAISAGDAHTCALLVTGDVRCWGWNIDGQLGDGSGQDSSRPVTAGGIANVRAVASGGNHSCALFASGRVACWGSNLYGQLGNGTNSDSLAPAFVPLVLDATALTTGLDHSCIVRAGGAVSCWGRNSRGQLGNGTTASTPSPTNVARLGLAPDGSGTVAVDRTAVGGGGTTLTFTYRVAPGGVRNGVVTLTPPAGWSVASSRPSDPGFTTATRGRVVTAGGSIAVTHLTLPTGATLQVVYGDRSRGGPGARAAGVGSQTWTVREQSSPGGALQALATSPAIGVLSPDGSGKVTVRPATVPHHPGQTIAFTFVAPSGGVNGGAISLTVPGGWSDPSGSPKSAGYVTASKGTVSVSGRDVVVGGLNLGAGEHVKVVYGARTGGGAGAVPPSANVGAQRWWVAERSSPSGQLLPLGSSPIVRLPTPDGAGRMSSDVTTVASGSRGNTVTFDYDPGPGGVENAVLALDIPAGWSPPSTRSGDPGFVRPSEGTVAVSGRRVLLTLHRTGGGRGTIRLVYGDKGGGGPGATAPAGGSGEQTWSAAERSSAAGHLTPLANPARITILAPDGSGQLQRATAATSPGAKGQTVVFTYVAAPGGLADGTLTIDVPAGWSAPSIDKGAAGSVTSSVGHVSVQGRTIVVSRVNLGSGQTLVLIYGNRGNGGPGATAPSRVGPFLWPAHERSAPNGALKPVGR